MQKMFAFFQWQAEFVNPLLSLLEHNTRENVLSLSLSSLRSIHAWVHENANSFELISKIHCKPSHPRDSKERKFPANANECHVTYPVLVLNRIYLRCCFFFNSKLLILLIYKNNNINTCQHQNTHIGIHTHAHIYVVRFKTSMSSSPMCNWMNFLAVHFLLCGPEQWYSDTNKCQKR